LTFVTVHCCAPQKTNSTLSKTERSISFEFKFGVRF
jgi:hypothetical protein